MTVSRTQSAARKGARKAKRFGHKLVNVQLGMEKNIFAVHEDLLCSSSKYFKKKLQKSRKPVEGDCSVCTEDIAGFATVSYCKTCGQNFHSKCIDNWLSRDRTCPLCRLEWPLPLQQSDEALTDTILPNLDGACFDQYMQWLYTGTIPDNGDRLTDLFKAHVPASYFKDSDYSIASRQGIIKFSLIAEATLPPFQLRSMYRHDCPQILELRKFTVDLCAARPSLVKLTLGLPEQFLLDLTKKLLSDRPIEDVDLYQALSEHLSEQHYDGEEGEGDSED